MAFPFLAAAQLVSGGISALKGSSQKKQANELIKSNQFPEMNIPKAIRDVEQMAELQSLEGLPSQQYEIAKKNIQQNTGNAIRTATNRRSATGLIPTIQASANAATENLGVADANARMQNRNRLMDTKRMVGQYEQNVWDWNKKNKYLQTAASARALLGAGESNIWGGVDRLLAGASGGANAVFNKGSMSTTPSTVRTNSSNPLIRYDSYGNEYYIDPNTGEPIK